MHLFLFFCEEGMFFQEILQHFYIFRKMKKLVHDKAKCLKCAGCVGVCPKMALDMYGLDLQIDHDKCIRCGICTRTCPVGALSIQEVNDAQ